MLQMQLYRAKIAGVIAAGSALGGVAVSLIMSALGL